MKRLILILFCTLFLSVSYADKVPGPDSDGDGIPDYKSCAMEDDGLFCEEKLDNCPNVKNTNQWISPNQADLDIDDKHKIGTACDYDIDGDGVPATTADWGRLTSLANSFNIFCSGGNPDPFCQPQNRLGDLTGGIFNGVELTTDGYPSNVDKCALLARNPDLRAQVWLPPGSSCNPFFK